MDSQKELMDYIYFLENVLVEIRAYTSKYCGDCRINRFLSDNYKNYYEKFNNVPKENSKNTEKINEVITKLRNAAYEYSEKRNDLERL